MSTCSVLSTLFLPVVAAADMAAFVHTPTNGMMYGM
jgi:hypothetical protein